MSTPVSQNDIFWLQKASAMVPEFVCAACGITCADITTEEDRRCVAQLRMTCEPVRLTEFITICRRCGIDSVIERTAEQSDVDAPMHSVDEILSMLNVPVVWD